MPALEAGVHAPEINLSFLDGGKFSLREALKKGPVVAAFFKVSCPVCQMAFPYLDRIYKAYIAGGNFTFVGVSQDNAAETEAFNREFGVTFPVLLEEKGYAVSNGYKLTNVPTVFMISPAGEIELTSVSWSKADMQELGRRLAKINNTAPATIFPAGESVPEYKPG
ncbi:MAG: peroxiredoxin family protein [Actinomycetota bacterium]